MIASHYGILDDAEEAFRRRFAAGVSHRGAVTEITEESALRVITRKLSTLRLLHIRMHEP